MSTLPSVNHACSFTEVSFCIMFAPCPVAISLAIALCFVLLKDVQDERVLMEKKRKRKKKEKKRKKKLNK
jgi:hypothetical protein